ncbi:HAMP domain-containing sensor histidine kinase [Microbispora sp. NPDC046933]|uniref:sensor histidine kinase n=1 Tax=Microbispora sp. NPDC046933 TaxID=3155618 RepID=UPI0033D1B395
MGRSILRERLERAGPRRDASSFMRWRSLAVVLAAAVAGRILVHRLLRRVGAISGDLAEINISDEHAQIAQEHDPRQVMQLVDNINASLDMLDRERQFAFNIAHEIRSPLAGIRVTVEEATTRPGEADYPRVLEAVLRGVDRLEALVAALLLIARSRAAQADWERIDLCELVRQEIGYRNDPIPTQVICIPGVEVMAMRTRLCQVITNLVDNAQHHATNQVQVHVERSDGNARIVVSDDGSGVPEKDRERIFDRLYQLKTISQRGCAGTGLGLAITRDIAKAHHGAVWVESSPLGGACFIVQLPIAAH